MTDSRLTFDSIWKKPPQTMTAGTDLERVLVDGARLPLPHWREHFLFKGAKNSRLKTVSRGRFPAKADPKGTHPVFALKRLAGAPGFHVCPCSSSPWRQTRWINRGTRLLHTGYILKKTSYIVEKIRFNLPASLAMELRFKGEAAVRDIHTISQGGGRNSA